MNSSIDLSNEPYINEAKKERILLMLDLETLSTEHNAAILSIGITTLVTNSSQRPQSFYVKINPADVSKPVYGFDISHDTMEWWKNQEAETRDEAFSGSSTVYESLTGLSNWITGVTEGKDFLIFGNGATFDLTILRNAFDTLNIPVPFTQFQEHCYRTIKTMFPVIYAHAEKNHPRTGKHNALEDARWQAKILEEIAFTLLDAHGLDLWEQVDFMEYEGILE